MKLFKLFKRKKSVDPFNAFLQACTHQLNTPNTLKEVDGFWTPERLSRCKVFVGGIMTLNGFNLNDIPKSTYVYTSDVSDDALQYSHLGMNGLLKFIMDKVADEHLEWVILRCPETRRETTLLKAKRVFTNEQLLNFFKTSDRYCILTLATKE